MNEKNLFELPADGWVQLSPPGEFPHKGAGVTQVVDREAVDAIVAAFDEAAKAENFPGVLVDFDHFSMDTDKPSEAAGWITALDAREDGLWAQVRWSDSGLSAVTGGRFRLVSPVFPSPDQCESLGENRIRPRRLLSVALTNEPNIKGGKPIANRKPDEKKGKDVEAGAKRLRWVLGEIKEGAEHCDVCLARAGQVKTAAEWAAIKAPVCHCHCSLEPVEDGETANRGELENIGWTDEARASSLAVRREKAAEKSSENLVPPVGGTKWSAGVAGNKTLGFDPTRGWLVKDETGFERYLPTRIDGDTVESIYGFKQVGKDLFIEFKGKWEWAGSTDVASINMFGGLELNPEYGANIRIGSSKALEEGRLHRDSVFGRWWFQVGNDWRDLRTGVLMSETKGHGYGMPNRWTDAARAARKNFPGWSDEARAASAAARRAKAGGGEADGFAAAFIRRFERFEPEAYPDPATGGEPWTVGFGSTRDLDGKPFKPGDRVTREQAEELLQRDMRQESAKLRARVPWDSLNARQQAALVSWAYNIGGVNAAGSTLAKRLSAGEEPAKVIREELPRWNKAKVKGRMTAMRGLTTRRLAEVALAEGGRISNRWTDAARAARKTFHGWSDSARAAAAAARSSKRAELKAKVADGTASPAERLAASLDAPFEDEEKRVPEGYEGPSVSSGGRVADESPDAIYPAEGTDLRDVVGAGPASGNGFLDAVTAGIGAATLLGGVSSGGKGGKSTMSAIQKSIARKQARIAQVARSRGGPTVPAVPAARSTGAVEKVCNYLKEGVNASRALITSYDLSALLRQGGILSFANPRLVPGAMASMFKALLSGASAEALDAQLRTRPNAALYRQGGLYLSDGPSGSMTAREEAYCSELAKMIPGVAASERAFSACLNRLRADCFDTMVEGLCYGHTPTTAELEAISNYINVATGRGSLGAFEKHAGALSTVFFAPKLAASRFEYLFGQPLTGGTGATRKLVAEQYARYLAGVATVYALSQMAGAEVGGDTNSSDAGKIRVGEKTRIDILSGLGQSLVFVSRMASDVYATNTGKEYQTDKMDAKVTQFDVEMRFLRTKLSPLAGANVDLLVGKDIVGRPVKPEDALLDLVVPLVARDVAEVYQEHRVPTATAEALLSVFGAGVAVYRSNRVKSQRQAGKQSTGLDTLFGRLTGSRPGVLEEAARRAVEAEKKARRGSSASRKAVKERQAGSAPEEKAMNDITMLKRTRRDGRKAKARGSGGAVLVTNRWSDAARAARRTFHGWSDSARAAAAAARAAKRGAAGGTYPDGQPVISDVIGAFDGNNMDPSKTYINSADGLATRQAAYAETFRKWWDGVERSAENIAKFNAFVASFGGAAAGGMGAYRQATGMSPSAGASQAFGRAGRYVTGKEPVYDESGSLTGFAGVGRRPYVRGDNAPIRQPYRKAGSLSFDEGTGEIYDPSKGAAVGRVRYDSPVSGDFFKGMRGMGPDPINNPVTKADFAFQASYNKWLDELNAVREAEQAALGRDPMGFPGGRVSTGDAEADEVLGLYDRVKGIVPRTPEEVDAYGDVLEGLRAYGEMYEADRTERDPGLLGRISEKLDELEKGSAGGGVSEAAADYEGLPYTEGGPAFAHPEEAAAAARALGVLHGSYGAGPEARDNIPPELLEDYVRGLEEGAKGYEYGVVTPKDRSAVLRRARAFADGKLGDMNEDYESDHIDDKYNVRKLDDPAAWATRNNPDGMVYDPSQPDTRSQYSPQSLMDSALSWFGDSMVKGDKQSVNAALSYMSDLMLAVAGDKGAVYRETVGDEDEAEVDSRVDVYDDDGNLIDEDSPFYEDSYADPNARPPWDDELPFERGLVNRLFEVYPPLAPLPELANARWTDAYRARVAARRAATAARTAARRTVRAFAAAKRAAEKQAKAYIKEEKADVKRVKAAVKEWLKGEIADANWITDKKARDEQIDRVKSEYNSVLQDAAARLANCTVDRMYELHPELTSGLVAVAFKEWAAEAKRIKAQFAYDKLVAEQDGTEVPKAPKIPPALNGFDFSGGVTAEMFGSDEEYQAALAEWQTHQGDLEGGGDTGGNGNPPGPGAEVLQKAYSDRLVENDKKHSEWYAWYMANQGNMTYAERNAEDDRESYRWFNEREAARTDYNKEAGIYGYARLLDDGRWVNPDDPDYGSVDTSGTEGDQAPADPPADDGVVEVDGDGHISSTPIDVPAASAAPAAAAALAEAEPPEAPAGAEPSPEADKAPESEPAPEPAPAPEEDDEGKKRQEAAAAPASNRVDRPEAMSALAEVERQKAEARAAKRRSGGVGNTGWTDAARAASLAVRRANAAARAGSRPSNPPPRLQKPRPSDPNAPIYAGGSPDFDERGSGSRGGSRSGGSSSGGSSRTAPARPQKPRPGDPNPPMYAGGNPDFDERDPSKMTAAELLAAGFKAERVPDQEALGFLPIARYDELIEQAKEEGDYARARRLADKKNQARKAAAKAQYDKDYAEFRAKRNSVYDAAVGREDGDTSSAAFRKRMDAAGGGSSRLGDPRDAYERAKADSAAAGRMQVGPVPRGDGRLPAVEPVRRFGTGKNAVFYDGNGLFYDADGNVVGDAPRAPKEGQVYFGGRWFDAKTGRAVPAGAKL